MLVMMLMLGLMAGLFAAVNYDQRSHAVDRDQSQAYAAAHAGLEKITSDLARLFVADVSPSAAQITAVSATPPDIYGFDFEAPGGGSGYAITFTPDANGNPAAIPNADITTGPFTGFKGLITPYTLTVTAKSGSGASEVRLRREIQTVALPVFQFGIFGERSLSFHAGDDFDFGGRVHTNQHLFLAEGGGILTFRDKLTAVGEVVRSQLANGNPITASGHTGTVRVPTVIGATYRNLTAGEGSVTGGPGSSAWSGWKNLSEGVYNANIRNTLTGAKRLDLPLVSQGAVPIDIIRRPALNSNEDTANAPVFVQRYFGQASLRILLSDRASDLTGLPTITGGAPIALDGDWLAAPPAGYTGGLPLARSVGPDSTTISGTSSTYSSGLHQLRVAAVPAAMQIPPLTIGAMTNVVCLGKTHNSFTGCTLSSSVTNGTAISATTPSGITVSTAAQLGSTVTAGTNKTITVPNNGTIPFANDFAWINDRASNVPRPMSCEGYDRNVTPQRLTNCRILGITVAQTTSGRVISTHAKSVENTSLIGGFVKIEKQDTNGVWTDVTAEVLSLGFAAPNQEGTICADPTPDAVIRLQRLRDNGGSCVYGNSPTDSRHYWPNVLFDAREASFRDLADTAPMTMGGVMNYVAIDVGNLKRWFAGEIGTTGAQALNNNGYIVYFSDRRGNHNDALLGAPETGEYGHEDSVNSAQGAASSAANGILEGGEDRNENGTLETYGATPSAVALYGALAPFDATATPLTNIANHPEARVNRQVFFRRALKLVNACIGTTAVTPGCNAANNVNNLPDDGLTVATENGAYVQGNYNATSTSVTGGLGRPAAVIADVITILSNNWTDVKSLNSPNERDGRLATTTGYRFAMIAGKSIEFPKPAWAALGNWGTDGGVHNFMRMLENWNGDTAYYRGSMVSLYTARQFIGIFKNNTNVYYQPERQFSFDTNFLTPALLPPGTPMFRDINTLKFRQILRPNQ
jgi:hypothetical protein